MFEQPRKAEAPTVLTFPRLAAFILQFIKASSPIVTTEYIVPPYSTSKGMFKTPLNDVFSIPVTVAVFPTEDKDIFNTAPSSVVNVVVSSAITEVNAINIVVNSKQNLFIHVIF